MANSTSTRRSADLVIEDLMEENLRLWAYVKALKDELEAVKDENSTLKSVSGARCEMSSIAVEQVAALETRERNRIKARQMSNGKTPRLDPMDLRCPVCQSTNIEGASPQLTQEDSGEIDCSICGHTSEAPGAR